ncbi:hypothetical protein M0R45_006557 [Rubus argutus]|uniref:MHC class I antigen n=1 Tax=Rubus argutus TaxID=59490 RepID=A0AAW1YRG6_RUBAR
MWIEERHGLEIDGLDVMTTVMGIDGSFVDRRKRHGWVVNGGYGDGVLAAEIDGEEAASAWQRRRRNGSAAARGAWAGGGLN